MLPLVYALVNASTIGWGNVRTIGEIAGALIAAAGMYWLSRIPVHGTYKYDLLPGMLVLALGFGAVFVGVITAANAGVPADQSGLAASLLNASQQLGGALGLAVFTALATSRTHLLLATHTTRATALRAQPWTCCGRARRAAKSLSAYMYQTRSSTMRTEAIPSTRL